MKRMIVVGAGLVGSLLSVYLARRGHKVDVYERKPDPRKVAPAAGRSINLTLCERGFNALDQVGGGDAAREITIPAYGRLIHSAHGDVAFQPYGNRLEAIHSISRNELNRVLLERAERHPGIAFHFNKKCVGVEPLEGVVWLKDTDTDVISCEKADRIFGADGAHSAVRTHLQKTGRFNFSQQYMEQGYKELTLPPAGDGEWALDKNAIHIWPRDRFMLIGFANTDGSFTCSLHMPYEGEPSFASIQSATELNGLFEREFPDALPLLPRLVEEYSTHPTNAMLTVRCQPWSWHQRVLLVGDAAHTIYPSYGQGANAGFEDCLVLGECMERHGEDWEAVFAEFENLRRPNTDAMADLCVEHFVEIRDSVGDPRFLLKKELERKLSERYPEKFLPLYSMITFTRMPYLEAVGIDRRQRVLVDRLMEIEGIMEKWNSPEVEELLDRSLGEKQKHFTYRNGRE